METKAKGKTVKKPVSKNSTKKVSKKVAPTHDEIKERAYQIYLEKGSRGSEMDNWLEAEKQLKK